MWKMREYILGMPLWYYQLKNSTSRRRSRSVTQRLVKLRRRHAIDATRSSRDRARVTQVKRAAAKIAEALNISGPVNIQFMAIDNDVKVIECNLRSDAVSKLNLNFLLKRRRRPRDVTPR